MHYDVFADNHHPAEDQIMKNRKAAKPTNQPTSAARVCCDPEKHTCIELGRTGEVVRYIPLEILGFEVKTMDVQRFDRHYQVLEDYPVDRAAKLYAEYAAQLGGTEEAMRELANLTPLTPKEIEMATAKKATVAAKTAEKAAKTAAAKPAAKAKAAPAKAVAKAAPAKAAKATDGERKPSAANMFKDLIMAGKLTDDQIFEKVQKEFGLDDNKRSYVKWYRNDLTKKGQNPPAPKG